MSEIYVPQIVTITEGKEHSIDLLSYEFTKERKISLIGDIDSQKAQLIVSQMKYLDSKSEDEIKLIINSPGGAVSDGMMIYDAIKSGISCDVVTVASGMAASMGAFLLAAGTKGKRFATENTQIMIHQPLGGVQGQATDISLVAEHIQQVKKKLAVQFALNCGKTTEELMHDMERDYWLSSQAALDYGIIDHIGFPE